VMLLVRFNLVTTDKLKEFRGYFIVGAFIVAAVVTPPDVISQLALAVPMVILYEIGIIGAKWFVKASRAPDGDNSSDAAEEKTS
jgi:sec-independent protein translocase protein TatC